MHVRHLIRSSARMYAARPALDLRRDDPELRGGARTGEPPRQRTRGGRRASRRPRRGAAAELRRVHGGRPRPGAGGLRAHVAQRSRRRAAAGRGARGLCGGGAHLRRAARGHGRRDPRARHRSSARCCACAGAASDGEIGDYEAALARASADPPAADPAPDDLYCLFYTSGTTGRPKGVMLSHRAYVADRAQPAAGVRPRRARRPDRPHAAAEPWRRVLHAALVHERRDVRRHGRATTARGRWS